MARLHVLLIDPDPTSAAATQRLIRESGLATSVQTAAASADAVAHLESDPPHVVLLDRSQPVEGEDAVWQALRARDEPPPVVVLSQRGDDAHVLDARRRGAAQFVQKPLDLAAIMSVFSGQGMYSFSASRHP